MFVITVYIATLLNNILDHVFICVIESELSHKFTSFGNGKTNSTYDDFVMGLRHWIMK